MSHDATSDAHMPHGAGQSDVVGPRDPFLRSTYVIVWVLSCVPIVLALAWALADQFNPACNGGRGISSWAPHSGTECAQANVGLLLLCVVPFGAAVVWSVAMLRQRSILTAEGIRTRGLVREEVIPWSDVHTIRSRQISTTARGAGIGGSVVAAGLNALQTSTNPNALWRVEALLRHRTRASASLGDFRGEAAADEWVTALTGWLRLGSASSPR